MKNMNFKFWVFPFALFFLSACALTCNKKDNVLSNENTAPKKPILENVSGTPPHGSTGQSIIPVLRWTCSDPDGDKLTYDVHFGKTSNPVLLSASQTQTSYSPDTLQYSTKYYWRIVAIDESNAKTSSDTWEFTTKAAPTESITSPTKPVGPDSGRVNQLISFGTGGSSSNLGHALEYRFEWGDGTYSNWTALTIGSHSWSASGTFNIRSQSRCATHTSAISNWSISKLITINNPPETVSVPSTPTGPNIGTTEQSISYSTGGATSNLGHSVQYRFEWGNGDTSGWSSSPTASHSWTTTGTYNIKAQSRCAINNSVTSIWSTSKQVDITQQPCSINVSIPSTGTVWGEEENHTITWNSSGSCGSDMRIELYKGSSRLCDLSSSTANDGSYSWTVDDCVGGSGDDYRIKIFSLSTSVFSFSGYFTIVARQCLMDITSPTSSANWTKGESQTITWASSMSGICGSTVSIELQNSSGKVCDISLNTTNDGSYIWVVDECGSGAASDYRIKITSLSTGAYYFSSWFTINLPPCGIQVTSPNSGSDWLVGDNHIISWGLAGNCGAGFKVQLYNGSTNLCTIYQDTDVSFIWTVTDCGGGTSASYRVLVTDLTSGAYYYSDYFFITVPTCGINVTSPSSGTVWTEGQNGTVRWTSAGPCGSEVQAELYNGSSKLCTYHTSTPNDGLQTYIVNDCGGGTGANYRIKVTDISTGVFNYSNYFTIDAGPWTTEFAATSDAFVMESAPSNNLGTIEYLIVGRDNDNTRFESFIRFGTLLSVLPSNAVIEQAELRLERGQFQGTVQMWVWLAYPGWSENMVNWNNRPLGLGYFTSISATTGADTKSINVTSHVRAWMNGEWVNYGFFLGEASTSSPGSVATFRSREFSDATKRPKLIVRYHLE